MFGARMLGWCRLRGTPSVRRLSLPLATDICRVQVRVVGQHVLTYRRDYTIKVFLFRGITIGTPFRDHSPEAGVGERTRRRELHPFDKRGLTRETSVPSNWDVSWVSRDGYLPGYLNYFLGEESLLLPDVANKS